MLRTGLAFLIMSLVAYVCGATGLVRAAIEIGRGFLIAFLVMAVLGVAKDLLTKKNANPPGSRF